MAAFCLSSVKCEVTRARTPPGFRRIDRFGEEEIVQGKLLAAIVELEVSERNVADRSVDAAFGKPGVAEILNADVMLGMKGLGDAAGDRIELDADETLLARAFADEIADTASWLQDGGIVRHA